MSLIIVGGINTSGPSTDDKFVTVKSEADLSSEFNLGGLTDGILKHTVTGGVSTPATAIVDTDYFPPLTSVFTVGKSAGCSTLADAVATIGATVATLIVPAGTHTISVDVTIPANIHLKVLRGAIFNIGTVAATGTIAYTYTAATGTLTTVSGNTLVTNTSTYTASGLSIPGQYIKITKADTSTATYQFKTNNSITAPTYLYNIYLWTAPNFSEAGRPWTYSTLTLTGTELDVNLEAGDFIYKDGQTLVVRSVTNSTTAVLYRHNAAEITSGSYTRGARLKIAGTLEAARYQIFSGNGVAKLTSAVVYPEWWGAKSTGQSADATTNTTAFKKAAYAMYPAYSLVAQGQDYVIDLAKGRYYINGEIPFLGGSSLLGKGSSFAGSGTSIYMSSDFSGQAAVYGYNVNYGGTIKGITFNGAVAPKVGNDYPAGIFIYNNIADGGQYSNLYIKDNQFWAGAGSAIVTAGRASCNHIIDNKIQCIGNGVGIAAAIEGWIDRNEINTGSIQLTAAASTMSAATGWTKPADWAISGVATHTAGAGTGVLSYPLNLIPNMYYLVQVTAVHTSGTSCAVTLGGMAAGTINASQTYYFWVQCPDPDADQTIKFTPTSNWQGTLDDVMVHSGYGITTSVTSNITNNKIWGASYATAPAAALFAGSGSSISSIISDNYIGPCGAGAYIIGGGTFKNNIFNPEGYAGIVTSSTGQFIAENNLFLSGVYGIVQPGLSSTSPHNYAMVARGNRFIGQTAGPFASGADSTPNFATAYDNIGYDIFPTKTMAWDTATAAASATATSPAITYTGAALGDLILMSAGDLQDCVACAYVSAANTAYARIYNGSGSSHDFNKWGYWYYQLIPARFARAAFPSTDVGTVVAGSFVSTDFTVPGVALGDFVYVTSNLDIGGLMMFASVTTTDTVTMTLFNPTGGDIDPLSATYRIFVAPGSKARLYATINEGAVNDTTGITTVVADTLALKGHFVMVAPGVDTVDFLYTGYTQANGFIEIRQQNETGAGPTTLASSNWRIWRGTSGELIKLFE